MVTCAPRGDHMQSLKVNHPSLHADQHSVRAIARFQFREHACNELPLWRPQSANSGFKVELEEPHIAL
jgi:hypothetical protein